MYTQAFPSFAVALDAYDDQGVLYAAVRHAGEKTASARVGGSLRPRDRMRLDDWAVVMADVSTGTSYPKLACGSASEVSVSVPYLLSSLYLLPAPVAKVAAESLLERMRWSREPVRLPEIEVQILQKVASIQLTPAEEACLLGDGRHVKVAGLGNMLSGVASFGRKAINGVAGVGEAIGNTLNRGAGAVRSGMEALRAPAAGAARAGVGASSGATVTMQTPQTLRMPAAQMDSTMMAPRARMGVPPPRAAAPAAAPPAPAGAVPPPPPLPPQMPTRPQALGPLQQSPRWTEEAVRARHPQLFQGNRPPVAPPPALPEGYIAQQQAGHLAPYEVAHIEGLMAQGGRRFQLPGSTPAVPSAMPGWSGGQGAGAATGAYGGAGATGSFGASTQALPPVLPAPIQSAYAPPPALQYADAPTVRIPRVAAPAGTFAW